MAMWLSFLGSFLLGYTAGLIMAYGVLLGVGLLGWREKSTYVQEKLPTNQVFRYAYVAGVFVLVAYTFVLSYTHFLPVDGRGNWMSAGYTWADMALHQTLAAYFAHQPRFELELPIFSGTNLSYPFLTDFLSGTVFRIAGNWQYAFFLPSVVSLLALSRLIISVGERLFKSIKAGWLLLGSMLFSGSAAAWIYFLQTWVSDGLQVAFKTDWTMQPENGLAVANWLTSHILPQRTYLAGFLVFLVLTLLWQAYVQQPRRILLVVASLLYGGLPFVHVHTFLVVSMLGVTVVIWRFIAQKSVRDVLAVGLVGVAIAIPQLWWQLSASFDDSFSYQSFGWMKLPNQSLVSFWFSNWGLVLPVAVVAYYFLLKNNQKRSWVVPTMLTGIGIFIACNLYSFQPYIWDNMKLLTYAYFFFLLPVVYVLIELAKRRRYVVTLFICFFITISGAITVKRELNENYTFLSASEVKAGESMLETIPYDAIVLSSERHNHPVTMVAGRKLFSGYPGWLWSYGVELAPRSSAAREIWRGGDMTKDYLEEFGITHAVLGPDESREVGFSELGFTTYFEEVSQVEGWRVFKVR
jgi:hypothetical protein